MEEFSPEDWDTLLAVSDPGSRPIGGFPHGFQATLIGTYQTEGERFDLWLLQREAPEEKQAENEQDNTPAE